MYGTPHFTKKIAAKLQTKVTRMKNFLQQVILDNTIQNYIIVAAIVLLGLAFKKVIGHNIAALIFYLLKRRYKNVDNTSFETLVAKPLGIFMAALITIVALDRLYLPKVFDFRIYHLELRELLRMIGSIVMIFTFFRFLIKAMDFVMILIKERYLQEGSNGNHQLIFFFKDFIKVLIGLIGVLLLLKYTFNYDIKGLITGLSIVGAAVALALKESLENLIASFIIFFDKPFETGNSVKVNGFSGIVEKIGLRSTRIRADDKTYITIPNKQMVDSVLNNLSNRTQWRTILRLEISVDSESSTVASFLKGVKTILSKSAIQSNTAFLTEITAGALVVSGEYYTAAMSFAEYSAVRQSVNLEILKLMETLGVGTSGNSTNVNIVTRTQESAS